MTTYDYELLPQPVADIAGDIMNAPYPAIRNYDVPTLRAVLHWAQNEQNADLYQVCYRELDRRGELGVTRPQYARIYPGRTELDYTVTTYPAAGEPIVETGFMSEADARAHAIAKGFVPLDQDEEPCHDCGVIIPIEASAYAMDGATCCTTCGPQRYGEDAPKYLIA